VPDEREAILISNDANGDHWQLGVLPPPRGDFALIGWRTPAKDEGVPAAVVAALARGLVWYGRVTFPCSSVSMRSSSRWRRQGEDYSACFGFTAGRGWRPLLPGRLGAIKLPLLSTVREEAVRGLFDDAAYPWWLQGQFALISPPEAAPPKLGSTSTRLLPAGLLGDEWTSCLNDLTESGFDALLRPGVDGDVAGLVARSSDIHRQLIGNIRRAAGDFGLACHVVPEDVFMERLATG